MRFRQKFAVGMVLILAAVLALLAVIGWRVWPSESTPTVEQLRGVTPGMTRAQVWSAVGTAPGDYPRGATHFHRVGVVSGDEIWRCPGCELHVWYDANDCVTDAVVYRDGEAPPERFRVPLLRGK